MQGGARVALIVRSIDVVRLAVAQDQDRTVNVLSCYGVYQLLLTHNTITL